MDSKWDRFTFASVFFRPLCFPQQPCEAWWNMVRATWIWEFLRDCTVCGINARLSWQWWWQRWWWWWWWWSVLKGFEGFWRVLNYATYNTIIIYHQWLNIIRYYIGYIVLCDISRHCMILCDTACVVLVSGDRLVLKLSVWGESSLKVAHLHICKMARGVKNKPTTPKAKCKAAGKAKASAKASAKAKTASAALPSYP